MVDDIDLLMGVIRVLRRVPSERLRSVVEAIYESDAIHVAEGPVDVYVDGKTVTWYRIEGPAILIPPNKTVIIIPKKD